MPSIPSANAVFRPMSGGNAITVAVVLYKSHFWQYARISGISTLWLLVPFLIMPFFLLIGVILTFSGGSQVFSYVNPRWLVSLVILVLFWFFLALWCTGKSLRNLALISRLAYQELAGQPETPRIARQNLRSPWLFLFIQFLVGLILQGVSLLLQSGFLAISRPLNLVFGSALPENIRVWMQLSGGLILFLVGASIYLWFFARFFIPEVILGVEPKTPVTSAISRSWDLSEGSSIRLLVALSIATGMMTPLYMLCAIPLVVGIGVAVGLYQEVSFSKTSEIIVVIALLVLVMVVVLFLINLVLIPFWQALKAVVYYDLRVRREGLGLELAG